MDNRYTRRNGLVGGTDGTTAENVCQVLGFLASVFPPDGVALNADDEVGRSIILLECVAALETIGGTVGKKEGESES